MTNIFKKIRLFIYYWYTRYLLATELYMVEHWERVVIHVLFGIVFGLLWYFNYSIVLGSITQLRNSKPNLEQIA